jgi:hypothetical protein
MKIKIAIKYSKERDANVKKMLQIVPDAMLIKCGTHKQKVIEAWIRGNEDATHKIVLEDDAILPTRFIEHATDAVRVAGDNIVNFYASRQNHKRYSDWIRDKKYGSFYRASYSGSVGVAMPTHMIDAVIREFVKIKEYPAYRCDIQMAKALQRLKIDVLYTYPSLVDHGNYMSIIQKRKNPLRRAIAFVGEHKGTIEWKI